MQNTLLEGANLRYADTYQSDFTSADLRNSNLDHIIGRWVDFSWADLTGATFVDSSLFWADFDHADLSETDLRNADMRRANLQYADLRGADLTDANLTGAFANSKTLWPIGFVPYFAGVVTWGN